MEIEVIKPKEYVRTEKGHISQNLTSIPWIVKDTTINGNLVVKHSKNLIDLIEAGDFVNGHKVNNISNFEYEIYDDNYDDWITKKGLHLECGDEEGRIIIESKDIKSIVTKEQFKSVEYRLEE